MFHNLLAIESLWLAAALALGSFILMILAEAVVMTLFKLNRFGRSFRDSVMANIGMLLLSVLLVLIFNKQESLEMQWIFPILFATTWIFESWIVKLLNPPLKWSRILMASFFMNLLSLGGAYFVYTNFIF
jgi:hypothetical protein